MNRELLKEIKDKVKKDYEATKSVVHLAEGMKLEDMNFEITYKNINLLIKQIELLYSHAPNGRNYTNEQYVELLDENNRYRKALEFYADYDNYQLSAEAEKADLTEFINVIDMDNGDKARKALEEWEWAKDD